MIYLMYSVMGTHQVDKIYSRISLYDMQDENRVFSIYSLLDRRQEVSAPGWSPGFRLGFDFTQAPPPPLLEDTAICWRRGRHRGINTCCNVMIYIS